MPPVVTVFKTVEFDAAHALPNYQGACQRLHGHTYKLQVGVTGPVQTLSGMVVDFSELKAHLEQAVVQHLDHQYLNVIQVPEFPVSCPTAERMVLWIAERLRVFATDQGLDELIVRLWETPDSYAETFLNLKEQR